MNSRLFFVPVRACAVALTLASAWLVPGRAWAFEAGQTVRIGQGSHVIMPKNSSLDAGAQVEAWTDAQTNSQRWVLRSATSGTYYLTNAYSDYYLACVGSVSAGTSVTAQDRTSAATRGRWELVPVEGKEGQYIIYANTTRRYALALPDGPADGNALKLLAVAKADSSQYVWTVQESPTSENTLTTAMRDDMMDKWRAHYYHKASTGYVIGNGGWWGDAEMFEVVLDALETTGDRQYATMFENLYTNFISRKTNNWISGSGYNEFNDDIAWMCIACVRAYLLTGTTKYLSTAKTNFDGMYRRAAKYDNGTLVWKEGNGGTNSCINGPAAVCACYLGLALGNESYFEKAKSIYAGERGLLYNINSQGVFNGQVYDSGDPEAGTVGNTWSSTYNQGTSLGAAIMLYEHFGTAQYRSDADAIMTWTAKNLANSHGIISVCQTVNGDLTGFKGILMRYVRRYAAVLGHPEYYDWLARNAYHAWNNRNSQGISMSAWLHKTAEDFYYSDGGSFDTDGVGAFTAVSAAFNAHLGVVDARDAYSPMQAQEFNFLRGTPIQATGGDDDGTGYAGPMRKDHYVGYRNVDFGTDFASHLVLRARLYRLASTLNVYLDAPSSTQGTLICTVRPQDEADRSGWVTLERVLDTPVTGKHDVYFVAAGAASIDLASLNWFRFDSRTPLYHDVTSPQGQLTTSLTDANHTLDLLTDGNPTTQLDGVMSEDGECWVQYDAPAPVLLQGYSVFSGITPGGDPTGLTLMGSDDGQEWHTLHEADSLSFSGRGQRLMYDVPATTPCRHFRLVLHGGELQTVYRLSEWQLLGRSVSPVDITADGGSADTCATLIDHQGLTPVPVPEGGVVYHAAGNYLLSHYTLTTGPADAPASWVLEGSANGTVWRTIDERTAVLFPYASTTATFAVRPDASYVWYRLRVTDEVPASLAQWQLFGTLDAGTFYPDASSLFSVSGPDGSSQAALVDDDVMTGSTVQGDSLYWLMESPLGVRPIAYSLVAAASREQTPTAVSVRGLDDEGNVTVLSSRNLSLNARGSRYTSTMATSKSFTRFQLLVTGTAAPEAQAASLAGFELYGTVLAQPGTPQMTAPESVEASAESASASETVAKLNDQNRLTGYRADFTEPLSITFSYAAPVRIATYALTAGKDRSTCDPTDWELQASDDGTEWVTLDRREGQTFSHRYATQFYSLPQPATYARYRLVVHGVNGGTQLQLTELQLLSMDLGTSLTPTPAALATAGMQVRGMQVQVDAPQAATLCVYDLQGRMLDARRVPSGQSLLPLPEVQGVVVLVLRMQGGTLVRKVRL